MSVMGGNTFAKKTFFESKEKVGVFALPCSMLTPLALFIQLGQLGIILPQRNQTAFITTV